LFSGPSGTGKTTLARLIAAYFACTEEDKPCGSCDACKAIANNSWLDYREVNCAVQRGIDAMKELVTSMRYAPSGRAKVYCLDEVQQTTKDAQSVLLKPTEDSFAETYIVLCTTDPQAILDTLRKRTTPYDLKPWHYSEAEAVAEQVFAAEGFPVSKANLDKFMECAFLDLGYNSPRAFLVAIEQVATAKSLRILSALDATSKEVMAISRGVFEGDWGAVHRAWTSDMQSDDVADEVRRAVCGYLRKALMNEKNKAEAPYIAAALKELAVRVQDSRQENNILARIFLATEMMSLKKG
jgi:DNA polymerase III delta prime subunit